MKMINNNLSDSCICRGFINLQVMAKGFVFDLNGTIIDDMHYHNQAWFDILTKDLKAELTWEQVKKEMYGKNSELLVRVFGPDKFTNAEMDEYSLEKERRYQQAYKPDLKLIAGLDKFLEKASSRNIPMAIGSAAIMFNIDFILDNLDLRKYFKAVVSADDVKNSKPDPETFSELCFFTEMFLLRTALCSKMLRKVWKQPGMPVCKP